MILFINTARQNKIFVALVKNNKVRVKLESKGEFHQSEKLLSLIDKLLKQNKVMPGDLTGIIVISGPGGFTSIRSGVVVANTLGFTLGIPVAGAPRLDSSSMRELIKIGLDRLEKVKGGSIVLPFYGREPNITKPKKELK